MAHPLHPRIRLAALLLVVALVLGAGVALRLTARKACCASVYKTFKSPDGRFQLIVYRLGWPWPMMPGSAGDAPGFVRLYVQDGKVLQEQDLEMVQLADAVLWEPRRVEITLVANWELPGP